MGKMSIEFLITWLTLFMLVIGVDYIATINMTDNSLITNGNEIIIDNSSYKCQMIKTLKEE